MVAHVPQNAPERCWHLVHSPSQQPKSQSDLTGRTVLAVGADSCFHASKRMAAEDCMIAASVDSTAERGPVTVAAASLDGTLPVLLLLLALLVLLVGHEAAGLRSSQHSRAQREAGDGGVNSVFAGSTRPAACSFSVLLPRLCKQPQTRIATKWRQRQHAQCYQRLRNLEQTRFYCIKPQ